MTALLIWVLVLAALAGIAVLVLWLRPRRAHRPRAVTPYRPPRAARRVAAVRAREGGDTEVTDVLPLPEISGTPSRKRQLRRPARD